MRGQLFIRWMARAASLIAATAFLLCAVRQAALAVDTSYLTLQGPNPITALCPMTLTFNARITGPPNSSVTYLWARFVNNAPQDSLPITATIPANGTLSLTPPPVIVDASTQGLESYGLNITSPLNSDSNTHGKVYITAHCLRIPQNVVTQLYVPPPTGLTQTGDQQVCGSHGAGFNCPIGMSNGWLVLVWCWGPSACALASTDQHIDTFNIYQVDNGKHIRVATTGPDQSGNLATAGFVHPPAGGFSNQCYAVSAVYGKAESSTSNAVCLGNGTTGQSTTMLQSTNAGFRYQHFRHQGLTSPMNWPLDGSLDCGSNVCVGYFHYTQGGADITNVVDNAYWRGYYLFDLSSLSHHYINRATLTLSTQARGWACVNQIGPADRDWWTVQDMTGGDFGPLLAVSTSPTSAILDVTTTVQAWANGSPNHGFVLQGFNENNDARDNDQCRGWFSGNAVLTVTHS